MKRDGDDSVKTDPKKARRHHSRICDLRVGYTLFLRQQQHVYGQHAGHACAADRVIPLCTRRACHAISDKIVAGHPGHLCQLPGICPAQALDHAGRYVRTADGLLRHHGIATGQYRPVSQGRPEFYLRIPQHAGRYRRQRDRLAHPHCGTQSRGDAWREQPHRGVCYRQRGPERIGRSVRPLGDLQQRQSRRGLRGIRQAQWRKH
jgi:hypothetical protein